MKLVMPWTEEQKENLNSVFTFEHRINETGLFTDEALAALLDEHPSNQLDVCTRGENYDPSYPNSFRTGDFRGLSGEQLIEAVKKGWIWINMRRAMNIHPHYKVVLDNIYTALANETGRKPILASGGILITAPVARTPYHFDKTEVVLWHLRGQKRVFVYPLEEPFIGDRQYEELLINPIMDDLPYEADFDKKAQIIDLQPGQAATWPLNSPHRVENSTFCVSITTEYSTRESGMKNSAMIANATLRDSFGKAPRYSQQSKAGRALSSVFGQALKKTGLASKARRKDMVSFKVDLSVPGCIVDVEPFERNF